MPSSYRRSVHPAARPSTRAVHRRRQHGLRRRCHRPLHRWLTATRPNPLRDLCKIVEQLIQSHYRLFPEDSPREQRRRAAQRRKEEEWRAWSRAHARNVEEDLQRAYGDPRNENG